MRKDLILKLADLLEKDANNSTGVSFDMNTWGTVSDPTNPVSCGTKACAMGLAALSGEFRDEGLGYTLVTWGKDRVEIAFRWDGERIDGLEAAKLLFDIHSDQAYYLFGGGEHGNSRRIELAKADELRRFAETGRIDNE